MPQRLKPIDETPAYETPDIDVTTEPTIDINNLHDFVKVDDGMLRALEAIEKQIREEPPTRYSIPVDVSNPFAR